MNTVSMSIRTDPELKAQALYADLLHAEAERTAGYQGRTGDEVLSEMRQIISDVERSRKKTWT